MTDAVYRELLPVMQKRGGGYPGRDIPEFFAMVEALFTPEQAAVNNGLPDRPASAKEIAGLLEKDEKETEAILETMADSGLCFAPTMQGATYYSPAPFCPGIMENQFMRGTFTDRDRRIARLIDAFKKADDALDPPSEKEPAIPGIRVITVDRTIDEKTTVHTYDQVKTYIEGNDSIAVASCYCRQEALLLGKDTHGVPMQVCMMFGMAADFVSQRLGGRKLSKEEAMAVLDEAEEAGLIHMARNITDNITFLCNCDRWHCRSVTEFLLRPRPARFLNSGFEPRIDPETCEACETCIDRCPATALEMGSSDLPLVDLDRCFGCAACATGCPSSAIRMVGKPDFQAPPKDERAWFEAYKANQA